MRLIWSEDAIESVDKTADYIEDNFGTARCLKFYEEVQAKADRLILHQNLGHIEPYLEGGKYEYRSLTINKLSKLIYRIDGETIRILYLWNTRRNPMILKGMFP